MAWNYWKGQDTKEIEKVTQKCLIELTEKSNKGQMRYSEDMTI